MLRHVISHLRRQDWTAVFIELFVIALLVAGYRPPNIASTSAVGPPTTTLTGEIGLIRDPTLRDLAMRLKTAPMFDSIHEEGIDNPYRKAFRMAIPYEVQDALRSAYGDRLVSTGDYKAIGHSLDHPCVRRIFTRAPLQPVRPFCATIRAFSSSCACASQTLIPVSAISRCPMDIFATCCARAHASRVTDLSDGRGQEVGCAAHLERQLCGAHLKRSTGRSRPTSDPQHVPG